MQKVEFKKGGEVFGVELSKNQIAYTRNGVAVRYKDVKPDFGRIELLAHGKKVAAAQGVGKVTKNW